MENVTFKLDKCWYLFTHQRWENTQKSTLCRSVSVIPGLWKYETSVIDHYFLSSNQFTCMPGTLDEKLDDLLKYRINWLVYKLSLIEMARTYAKHIIHRLSTCTKPDGIDILWKKAARGKIETWHQHMKLLTVRPNFSDKKITVAVNGKMNKRNKIYQALNNKRPSGRTDITLGK